MFVEIESTDTSEVNMAAGSIPAPGTKYGPCKNICAHLDCTSNRVIATSVCSYCSKAIGYEKNFYRDGGGYAHAVCLETAIENEQRAKDARAA